MRKIVSLILLLSLISCIEKFDNHNLDTNYPKTWSKKNDVIKQEAIVNWWDNFADEDLSKLIDEGLKANSDINIALLNIEQAQSNYQFVYSDLLPSAQMQIGSSRAKNSTEVKSTVSTKPFSNYQASASLNWQLDLWSKLKNAKSAARLNILAAQSTKDNVELTVASNIAHNYFKLISLNAKRKFTSSMIDNQTKIYDLYKLQNTVGVIDQTTLLNNKILLNNILNMLPSIDLEITQTENSLKILIGKKTEDFLDDFKFDKDISKIVPSKIVPKTMPSQLVVSRPDIKSVEENLKSANISVEIARSYYLPDVSLTALLGLASNQFDNLFKSAGIWQLSGMITAPLFDFGKNKANVLLKEAVAKEMLINYQAIIKIAFSEVLNALDSQEKNQILYDQTKNNEEAQISVNKINKLKYETGYSSLIDLLNSYNSLNTAQIATIDAKLVQLNSMIDIFKALGGRW